MTKFTFDNTGHFDTFNKTPHPTIRLPLAVKVTDFTEDEVDNLVELLCKTFGATFSFSKESTMDVIKEQMPKKGVWGQFHQSYITVRKNFRGDVSIGAATSLDDVAVVMAADQIEEVSTRDVQLVAN
ncbi:hypothetical protein VCHA53O466_140080 [Vibrio chagasii]|nr:hypothetical protein VCHA53O466_140080 [Vibrio chagasii]